MNQTQIRTIPEGGAWRSRLADLYASVEKRTDEVRPTCNLSGRCCDFPKTDHELWSSGLELSYAIEKAGGVVPESSSGSCPWYVGGMCSLREGRPLGCRLYFCDESWAQEMGAAYEKYHGELMKLHEEAGIPYRYERFVDGVARARETGSL